MQRVSFLHAQRHAEQGKFTWFYLWLMQAVLLCSAKLAGKRQVRRKNDGTGKTRDRSSSQFICQLELQLLFQPTCVRLSFFFTVPCFLFFYSFVFYFFLLFFLFTSRFTVLGFYPSSEIVDHFVSSILDFTLSSIPPLLLFSSAARFFSLSSDPVNQFFLAGY